MQKDFWRNSKVAFLGGGAFGTTLATLVAQNCREVRLWMKEEDHARAIQSTRRNETFLPGITLPNNLQAMTDLDRVFADGVQAVFWVLPSSVCRQVAKVVAPYFSGEELLLHATKGIEMGSLKRISEILAEELPCPRIGVVSGPNLATEISRGEPAATVVASPFDEVLEAGSALLGTPKFRIYPSRDVVGVEWAGTLKNILALAAGALDALEFGWNTRAMLITLGIEEMIRFAQAHGGSVGTFMGLAGIGDLMATASSPLSRNYRVGQRLAKGEPVEKVLQELGSTAEGVKAAEIVWHFAQAHSIEMPITAAVYRMTKGEASVKEMLEQLMLRPARRF